MKITLDIQSSATGDHTRLNKQTIHSGIGLVGFVTDWAYNILFSVNYQQRSCTKHVINMGNLAVE